MAGQKNSHNDAEQEAIAALVELAEGRMSERPEIYFRARRLKKGKSYSPRVGAMVEDMFGYLPEMPARQLSRLLGLSHEFVNNIRNRVVPKEQFGIRPIDDTDQEYDEANNVKSSDAELAALRAVFQDRQYQIDPLSKDEIDPATMRPADDRFMIRHDNDNERRASYREIQERERPRPITLPTTPFRLAA